MEKLGRYLIQSPLGEGGMAYVYKAYDPEIGRVVAIKALKGDRSSDFEIGARFVQEARAAGALSHPNIATIYDVGEAEGIPYIAMELVEGLPLDEYLLKHGTLPLDHVLNLALQLADGLAYAHSRGVVHRDIKPSNILLSADGRTAKLLDFGVARLAEEANLARTQVGQLVGTPRYMSPEQALGVSTDHRSDLFSFGSVLYEMVAGRPAFDAAGLASIAIQIAQTEVVPLQTICPACPPGLRQIIEKLLAKKPDNRFPDAEQVGAAIRRELSALTSEDVVGRRGFPLRWKLPLALLLVTATTLGVSIYGALSLHDEALERMAVTSGQTMTAFVSKNAAISLVDNAGLSAAEQDWAPLQAFVATAGEDSGITAITVSDADGVVRASSDTSLVGKKQTDAGSFEKLSGGGLLSREPGYLRFVRQVDYAGGKFGHVELSVLSAPLENAIANTHALLFGLATIVLLMVIGIGYMSGKLMSKPLNRLRDFLERSPSENFALRISHSRSDEIGTLFDSYNRMAAEAEHRLKSTVYEPSESLDKTVIRPVPSRHAA